jgi:hypothetical protein
MFRNSKFWEELSPTLIWYDTDRIENDASKNYSLLRVFVAAGTCIPSSCLATIRGDRHTDTQTGGKDLWSTTLKRAQVPWYTKFRKDWVRHSKAEGGGGYTDTAERRSHTPTFFFLFHKLFLLMILYWKAEFSNLAPHLVCFCILSIFVL